VRWPCVNERVLVHLAGRDSPLASRVEDVRDDAVAIAIPTDGRVPHVLPVGTTLGIEWLIERGLVSFTGCVSARTNIGVPVLVVRPVTATVITQRRDFVRSELVLPAVVGLPSGAMVRGTTVDVSGGGASVGGVGVLEAGTLVWLRIELESGALDSIARVVRSDDEVTALAFADIDAGERERLIRIVFAHHRRMYALVAR
jgi:c-di-GMP-binding flagellar brake protein YcgR